MTPLIGKTTEEIKARFIERGLPAYRGKQVADNGRYYMASSRNNAPKPANMAERLLDRG
jgi:hypothetical protein